MWKITLIYALLKPICFYAQVGLAVGDIDSIQQNATLKRLAMQVEFVAEIEESYPRFVTRRVYHPSLVVRPNRPTRWKRYLNLFGAKFHRGENCTSYISHSVNFCNLNSSACETLCHRFNRLTVWY